MANKFSRIYEVVAAIPRGRVATYGQIAVLSGIPRRARFVGYALRSIPEEVNLPWHRVVNAGGCISPRSDWCDSEHVQRLRLEHEGVEFDSNGRIPLERFQWRPE